MAKIYQVRYTVGDKTVAHEHYTEKGGKSDAKQLSKVIGNAMLGEIEIGDDGARALLRVWEYTGGDMGKPIKREGPPTEVEVIKSVDDTKTTEAPVVARAKAPRLTDEERIAKIKEEAQAKLDAIAAGTFVLPTRGRKPSEEGGEARTRKPKVEADRVSKLVETLKVSDNTAKLLAAIGLNAASRRTKVAVPILEAEDTIRASDIMNDLNKTEEKKFDMKEVVLFALHLNYLFSRENQPWKTVVQDLEGGDKIIKLVSSPIEAIATPQQPPAADVA